MAVDEECLSAYQLSVNQTEADRKKMVPAFVTDVDRVYSADFNVVMTNHGRPMYEYTVSWSSKSKAALERWDKIISTGPKEEPKLVPCDGTCGCSVSSTNVVQFGNCDHNICESCLKKSPNRVIFDGTPACCNPLCVQRSVLSPASMSSSGASSFLSFSQIFVVNLRILIFVMEKGHISRRQGACEVNSDTALSEIREKIEEFVSNLSDSNLFYTTTPNFRRSDLVKISLNEMTEERELRQLEDEEEHFTFVVACPGVTIVH